MTHMPPVMLIYAFVSLLFSNVLFVRLPLNKNFQFNFSGFSFAEQNFQMDKHAQVPAFPPSVSAIFKQNEHMEQTISVGPDGPLTRD